MNYPEISSTIENWLHSQLTASGLKGFVVGISGGIDSAVVSALCARTGLPTLAISMPIRQKKNQVSRARLQLSWLERFKNTAGMTVDLTRQFDDLMTEFKENAPFGISEENPVLRSFNQDLHENEKLSGANLRSRLRMCTLYFYAGCSRYLVAGTGNKVEDYGVGFFTKYGDGGVDLSPIGDLMKSEVYRLAGFLGIPDEIRQAKPTDGLWDRDRTDEQQLGDTYHDLEIAMRFCELNRLENLQSYEAENMFNVYLPDGRKRRFHKENLFGGSDNKYLGISEKTLKNYLRRHSHSVHKMNMPPVCRI
jgi:NAD+ synthase